MIWILADSYLAAVAIARDQELQNHRSDWLWENNLYKILGFDNPVVLVQDCYSRPAVVMDTLRARGAVMIRVVCPDCRAAHERDLRRAAD